MHRSSQCPTKWEVWTWAVWSKVETICRRKTMESICTFLWHSKIFWPREKNIFWYWRYRPKIRIWYGSIQSWLIWERIMCRTAWILHSGFMRWRWPVIRMAYWIIWSRMEVWMERIWDILTFIPVPALWPGGTCRWLRLERPAFVSQSLKATLPLWPWNIRWPIQRSMSSTR